MKTLLISEDLLKKICQYFLSMKPDRLSLIDSCFEAYVYDRLIEDFPEFMKKELPL